MVVRSFRHWIVSMNEGGGGGIIKGNSLVSTYLVCRRTCDERDAQ